MSSEEAQNEKDSSDRQEDSRREEEGQKNADSIAQKRQHIEAFHLRRIPETVRINEQNAPVFPFEAPRPKRQRMREVSLSAPKDPKIPTLIVDQSGPSEQWRNIINNVLAFPRDYYILCSGCSRQTECTMVSGGIVRCTRCGKATPIRPAEDHYRWIHFGLCDKFNQIRNGMRITSCPVCTDFNCVVKEADSCVRLPQRKDCSRESSASPPSPEVTKNNKSFPQVQSMGGQPPFAHQPLPMNPPMNPHPFPNQFPMQPPGHDRNMMMYRQ